MTECSNLLKTLFNAETSIFNREFKKRPLYVVSILFKANFVATFRSLQFDWSDFYNVDQPNETNSNFFNDTQFINLTDKQALTLSSDAYVVNCYFSSITYSDDGGAISISGSFHFLVEFSSFVSCATTGSLSYGGALYISYAHMALNHVCAIQCESNTYYSFAWAGNKGRITNDICYLQ